jgi:hypothetical protein
VATAAPEQWVTSCQAADCGLKPRDNDEIIRAGLESGNPAMLDLLISSGFSINPSNVPAITSRTTSPSFWCCAFEPQ